MVDLDKLEALLAIGKADQITADDIQDMIDELKQLKERLRWEQQRTRECWSDYYGSR